MDVLHVFPTVPFRKYVEVDVPNSGNNQTFTGAVSVDEKEELIKVIVAKDNRPGPVTLKLNNIPFDTSGIEVDLYKVVDEENDGLQFQRELTPALAGQDIELFLEGEDMEANTAWMVIVKQTDPSRNSSTRKHLMTEKQPKASRPLPGRSPGGRELYPDCVKE